MLNLKQLQHASTCWKKKCLDCAMYEGGHGNMSCQEELAQTALAYREMLKRLEWGAIANWGNDRRCMICQNLKSEGHKSDCELAAMLKEDQEK